jgi:hypothetical protein
VGYRILERHRAPDLGHYAVRAVGPGDVEVVRQWRNAQLPILRQKQPIDERQQLEYYESKVWGDEESATPSQMLFVLTYATGRIAYGGLTYIDWDLRRGELSFLTPAFTTADAKAYRRVFRAFLEIVVRTIAFDQLGFHRVWHESYDVPRRWAHHRVLHEFGFELEGTLRDHALVEGKYADSLIYGMVQ